MSTDWTNQSTFKVIIPFRLREGADMRRQANLDVVMAWWWAHGIEPVVVDDGLTGDAQFNRHKAYNEAVSRNAADVYVFTEADMLIDPAQIFTAVRLAVRKPCLVVPFTEYRYLSDGTTAGVRDAFADNSSELVAQAIADGYPFNVDAESTVDNGRSIGAVNVISKKALDITGGFTEATHGNWYDDRITEEGFSYLLTARTQHVPGPAVHLYHLPGWAGAHLTPEDKAATLHNREILKRVRSSIRRRRPDEVRAVMAVRA